MINNEAEFLRNVLSDLKVELADEFDKNFERKAFFDQAWPETSMANGKGSLMNRTGDLRKSVLANTDNDGINFTSSLPYADLHNQGGELTVTMPMKKFFWAMYYTFGKPAEGEDEDERALAYKYMAMMKVGDKIKIPQRQFIGHHPMVDKSIEMVVDMNVKELEKQIFDQLKNII